MDPFADQNPPILFFPSVYPTSADLGISTCTSSSAAQQFRLALLYHTYSLIRSHRPPALQNSGA